MSGSPPSSPGARIRTSGSASLPKANRLRKRAEYLLLANSHQKFITRGFLVVWRENRCGCQRLGITASRKIGGAVVRNRIKRYVREVFRHWRHRFGDLDINVIARSGASNVDYHGALRELEHAFSHISSLPCVSSLHYLYSESTGS